MTRSRSRPHGAVARALSQGSGASELSEREDIERLCMRNLLASGEERVYFKDRDSRFVLVSEGWLAAEGRGYAMAELIGKTDFDIFSRPHAIAAFADEQRVMRSGRPMVGKTERETFHDRPGAWVQTIKMPLRDEHGEIIGTFGISRDVTAQVEAEQALARKAEQAVEASNIKSAFLANVSHEIRTPMNGVIGMLGLLLETTLTDEQREYAELAGQSGEHMIMLINDILDLSKIETGHFELDCADFALREMIEDTCDALGAQVKQKGLRLETEISSDVPAHAHGDGRRLRQVLLNLVSNAVKFTSEGTVVVRVSAEPGDWDGTRIAVEVADQGIGIDPELVGRMFEPFTQADVSTTRLFGGTGLGLSIARELVQLMGGTIGAQSEPGRGSTFRFEVELAAPIGEASDPATAADADNPLPRWPSTPLVLVAEDSPVNQIVAMRLIERCGCHVVVAGDGSEALRLLEGQRFDAVLMDCQMPTMDGYQATEALRRSESGTQRTPVIAMTAHAMKGDRERCLDSGMDDYITKPVRFAELEAVLHRWIPDRPLLADAEDDTPQ